MCASTHWHFWISCGRARPILEAGEVNEIKHSKGLEQFRKLGPLSCSLCASRTLWLFLYTQHGLHFVAFNNLPLQASTPWDTFPPPSYPGQLYLRCSVSTNRQLQTGSPAAQSGSGGKFLPVAQHANTAPRPPPFFFFLFAAQALYCSFIDWEGVALPRNQ